LSCRLSAAGSEEFRHFQRVSGEFAWAVSVPAKGKLGLENGKKISEIEKRRGKLLNGKNSHAQCHILKGLQIEYLKKARRANA
jgi:hypothetical protein